MVYEAIQNLGVQEKPIDMLTVTEQLRNDGTLEQAGGPLRISELTAGVSSAANIEYHAHIIAQKYLARELISFSSKIQTMAFDETIDVYDLMQEAEGVVVEQLIRPTGLLDPEIDVRPSENQIDDLLSEIVDRTERNERVLVTTLTKRMAEELTEYLLNHNIKAAYIHSDVATLDRVKIMNDLRAGVYDVLVGVNLLREGLDLPEVSLVAILDADKEGFLRSHRSLTQTAGRAARNVNGKVIMYADTITDSMQRTIDETARRRSIQLKYNADHHITPKQIVKDIKGVLPQSDGSGYEQPNKPNAPGLPPHHSLL